MVDVARVTPREDRATQSSLSAAQGAEPRAVDGPTLAR